MTDFRCPHCKRLAEVASSEIGSEVSCSTCRQTFRADEATLARFEVPSQVKIVVLTTTGTVWRTSRPVLLASRGRLDLPPLRTNIDGEVVLTRQMFSDAVANTANAAIMDFHDDYRLVRYLEVRPLSKAEGGRLAAARAQSGWSIQPQEREMYGTLPALLEGFAPSDAPDVEGAAVLIDLEQPPTRVELRVELSGGAAEPGPSADGAAPRR